MSKLNKFENDIEERNRFEFGKNWTLFLNSLTDEQISRAEQSFCDLLGSDTLENKTFLDIGSGSGLSSLVARRLGACVHSFDYDPNSVRCTEEIKRRYFCNDEKWVIEQGSVLDENYLNSLGAFDIVYSWGVLHHTGDMWAALKNVDKCVKVGGTLFISIYNDQGYITKYWLFAKKMYNKSKLMRYLFVFIHLIYPTIPYIIWNRIRGHDIQRGMSVWYDLLDWLGGYPFEVATPDKIVNFYQQQNYELIRLKGVGRKQGCNEYIFVKR